MSESSVPPTGTGPDQGARAELRERPEAAMGATGGSQPGPHLRAGPGSEPDALDDAGLGGQVRGRARIVVDRFVRQRLSVTGLVVFAVLGVASAVVGHV